jgi:salicylate hydroxylase
VEVILKSEAVAYDADEGSVTLTDASVHYADLIVAADGVHSSAVHQVTGHATPAASTGSAAFRFLIPTETLQQDPETASLLEDGLMRVIVAEGVRRLVWYPCSKYEYHPLIPFTHSVLTFHSNTIQNFVGIHADQQVKDGEKEGQYELRSKDVTEEVAEFFEPCRLESSRRCQRRSFTVP